MPQQRLFYFLETITMNKNILVGIGIIAVLGILFWLGRGNINDPNNSANLSENVALNLAASEDYYNFGEISMAAGKISHDFKVKNSGAELVKIEKLYTSCMCTAAYFFQNGKKLGPFGMSGHGFVPPLRKIISPGEEVIISVTFDPAAHGPAGVGPIEREIYLEDKSGPLLTLGIGAKVTP